MDKKKHIYHLQYMITSILFFFFFFYNNMLKREKKVWEEIGIRWDLQVISCTETRLTKLPYKNDGRLICRGQNHNQAPKIKSHRYLVMQHPSEYSRTIFHTTSMTACKLTVC